MVIFQWSKRTTVWTLSALVVAMVIGQALQISTDPLLHLVQIPLVLVLSSGLASTSLED